MSGSVRVSVCMATYNGAPYVEEQLTSILAQLSPTDEVVVVDDASTDDTVARVAAVHDPRVRVEVHDVNRGYASAFETALGRASGDHVLLADQDDVWPADRVAVLGRALEEHAVVAGNLAVLGTGAPMRGPFGQRAWRLPADPLEHRATVLLQLALSNVPYFGSAMGLRRELLALVLPFPPTARELPDAWIALVGLATRSIAHVDDVVVLHRMHDANTSGTVRSPRLVLRGRWYVARMVVEARRRSRLSRGA